MGFTEPSGSPRALVRSCRTVSPLPVAEPLGLYPSAVCFLWHFPAGHPDWPLASTLPCGVPTFLDQAAHPVTRATPGRDHPATSLVTDIVLEEGVWPHPHGPVRPGDGACDKLYFCAEHDVNEVLVVP